MLFGKQKQKIKAKEKEREKQQSTLDMEKMKHYFSWSAESISGIQMATSNNDENNTTARATATATGTGTGTTTPRPTVLSELPAKATATATATTTTTAATAAAATIVLSPPQLQTITPPITATVAATNEPTQFHTQPPQHQYQQQYAQPQSQPQHQAQMQMQTQTQTQAQVQLNSLSSPAVLTLSDQDAAVSVRHAFKAYGNKKNLNQVLNNLNMNVPRGTIYGLLGASGCGKTTLLSCIVGRRRLDSGDIFVLGGKPGAPNSGVPGKRVGYMPQEIALYAEFSIQETMLYFGWIFGMQTKEIMERLRFLLNFLDLPSENRLVKNLSGGQQRRVSFAVALMHDPELLILDEPTVGVDPLLRKSIWNHLIHITKSGQKTVIITTHYIEEARQAHTIGLMRSGLLLAEESPSVLLSMYKCLSLEEVFLKLSRLQVQNGDTSMLNFGKIDKPSSSQDGGVIGLNFHQSKEILISDTNGSVYTLNQEIYQPPTAKSKNAKKSKDFQEFCTNPCKMWSKGKVRALLIKNMLRMWRNVGVMLFIFALPVIQVILFCLAIGRDPTGLTLAIVNDDSTSEFCTWEDGCHFTNLSCRYLHHLNDSVMVKTYYSTVDEAIDAVRNGRAWGAIYITDNFTDAFTARANLGKFADEETIEQSEIKVWLDMSNQQIGVMLNRDITFAYRDFVMDLLEQCNQNPKLGDVPIQFKEPIYGTMNPTFTDFVAPGVILTIVFFLAVALTSSALIIERTEGLLDRSWVAGVTPSEVLFSHVATQFVVMTGQTILVLLFMLVVFGVTNNGNLLYVVLLTLLQGLCGMCFGFLISSVCDLERNAIQLALGSFYPMLLLSGVIWPIEGMPWFLRYISLVLPLTLATSALRSILTRGWDLLQYNVYVGFLSTIAWIVGFLCVTMVVMRMKRG